MRKTIGLWCSGILLTFTGHTQTIAPDWSLTDCNGTPHQLYAYLNNEEVVIMEFAMGCAGCTDAAPPLIGKRNTYAITHPGKVKAMYMDYWAGNDCATDILPVAGSYDFDGIFGHCNTEKSYYFGSNSPMPGIVVAAGSQHKVIYQQMSFAAADTVAIGQAIDSFFMAVSIPETLQANNQLLVYPDPAQDDLSVQTSGAAYLAVMDITGKQVAGFYTTGILHINIANWPRGMYLISDTQNGQITKWVKE